METNYSLRKESLQKDLTNKASLLVAQANSLRNRARLFNSWSGGDFDLDKYTAPSGTSQKMYDSVIASNLRLGIPSEVTYQAFHHNYLDYEASDVLISGFYSAGLTFLKDARLIESQLSFPPDLSPISKGFLSIIKRQSTSSDLEKFSKQVLEEIEFKKGKKICLV